MIFEEQVPAFELCRMIRGDQFADSALVWVKRNADWLIANRNEMGDDDVFFPAPTLVEIHAAMGAKVKMSICRRSEDGKWYITIFWPLEDGRTMITGEIDKNPATAALKCYYGKRNAKVV